jgi:N-acetyl-alpha-D-muramate 1-phosphate uridylyltransferase
MNKNLSEIPVAILAGGLATRLGDITKKIPKSLVNVAGNPILFYQLELLRAEGIRKVVLCIGHLGEMIQQSFGSVWNDIQLEYSFDGEMLLGTGGSIKNAIPKLGDEFFILNGDTYLPVNYSEILRMFNSCQRSGLVTVYKSDPTFNLNNIIFKNGEVIVYDKYLKSPEMEYVDSGLCLFKSSVFEKYPSNYKFDLSKVFSDLLEEKELFGYQIYQKFYDMGSPRGLSELESLLGV